MSETKTYRRISADTHVNEPRDLWSDRVSAKFRDRAPRMQRFDEGDAWIIEGVADPLPFGLNACAGMPATEFKQWCFYEDIRDGGRDPRARIQEMDQDGVDAEVLYPTPRLHQSITGNQDAEFHLELVQAYNDWLSEYVEHDPARFGGLALLPNRGADQAAAEVERVWGRPGIRGFVMGCYPNGTLEIAPEDDRIWEFFASERLPVNIHVALTNQMPSAHRNPLPGAGRFYDAPKRMEQLIFSGVLDRYPSLEFVFAEVDCGWVPYCKEQLDNNFWRLSTGTNFSISEPPSAYIDRHFNFSFMIDSVGIRERANIGVEHMLWSTDYPHVSADWPQSWKTLLVALADVPAGERDLLLAGNAKRLYRFG